MPKPVTVPTWATDANYPAGAEPEATTPTKVAPAIGKTEIGWRPTEFPPAQYFNHLQNLNGQWAAYLDAGEFEGNHTIDGDLLVLGDVNVTQDVSANNLFFATERTKSISHTKARPLNAASTWTMLAGYWGPDNNEYLIMPLDMNVGERISSVVWHVLKGTNGATTLEMDLIEVDNITGVDSIPNVACSTNNNANAPGYIPMTCFAVNLPIVGGGLGANPSKSYYVRIKSDTGGAADHFHSVDVIYTRPA